MTRDLCNLWSCMRCTWFSYYLHLYSRCACSLKCPSAWKGRLLVPGFCCSIYLGSLFAGRSHFFFRISLCTIARLVGWTRSHFRSVSIQFYFFKTSLLFYIRTQFFILFFILCWIFMLVWKIFLLLDHHYWDLIETFEYFWN